MYLCINLYWVPQPSVDGECMHGHGWICFKVYAIVYLLLLQHIDFVIGGWTGHIISNLFIISSETETSHIMVSNIKLYIWM